MNQNPLGHDGFSIEHIFEKCVTKKHALILEDIEDPHFVGKCEQVAAIHWDKDANYKCNYKLN